MAVPGRSDAPPPLPSDDAVIVFRTVRSGVQGRLVRLGAVAEKVIGGHSMPDAASVALGEALVLAALLGSALQDEGSISVQTRTDGVVSVLYADCEAQGKLRGYARYDAETLSVLAGSGKKLDAASILGDGYLAITVDQGGASERYQGVIALDGGPLDMGAAAYFEQRENLPTFVRLAVARHYAGAQAGLPSTMRWRGGGLMMQRLESDSGDDGDDPWSRVRMLTATVEDHELLDPELAPERLLLRLFHEEGIIIERVVPLTAYCKCSRNRIVNVLGSFGAEELADMRDDNGKIAVTCEFCATTYYFDLPEIGAMARNRT
jgi:molecular chaperone Hsp33